jgi:hypothetical protein
MSSSSTSAEIRNGAQQDQPEDGLVGADHLTDLAVAADDDAVRRRPQLEEPGLGRGPRRCRPRLLPIGLGAVIGALGHHLTLDQHRQTIEFGLGIAFFRLGDLDRSAQIVVFELGEDLAFGDGASLIDGELDEPRHVAGGDRHHDGRLDRAGRIDRLDGRPPVRMHDSNRGWCREPVNGAGSDAQQC